MTDHIIPMSLNQPIITTVKTHLEVTCDPVFDEAWINGVHYVPAQGTRDVNSKSTPNDRQIRSSSQAQCPATDRELKAAASQALDQYKYASEMPYFLAPGATENEPLMLMLRAVYDLGYEQGAAAQEQEQELGSAKSSPPPPVGDQPLWELMRDAYAQADTVAEGMADEILVVADWLEAQGDGTPWMEEAGVFATSLRAEAERAEGEGPR